LTTEKAIKPLHTLTKTPFVYIVLSAAQASYPQVIHMKNKKQAMLSHFQNPLTWKPPSIHQTASRLD